MTIEELRQKRIELGLSQGYIAEALGINRCWLSLCEKRKKQPSKALIIAYKAVIDECQKVAENLEFVKKIRKK